MCHIPGYGRPREECLNPGLMGMEWKCEQLYDEYHGGTSKIAGEQCYLEMDVVYKADKAGLDHLDIGKQASAEECRDWCRYL